VLSRVRARELVGARAAETLEPAAEPARIGYAGRR
jgi:hypothetical protein